VGALRRIESDLDLESHAVDGALDLRRSWATAHARELRASRIESSAST
jgi:hypothetical protein